MSRLSAKQDRSNGENIPGVSSFSGLAYYRQTCAKRLVNYALLYIVYVDMRNVDMRKFEMSIEVSTYHYSFDTVIGHLDNRIFPRPARRLESCGATTAAGSRDLTRQLTRREGTTRRVRELKQMVMSV